MEIIFCDNHVLIVSKPAGISTQPHGRAGGESDNLLDKAKAYLKKKFQKPGLVFLEPIHRLDTPVSGLVLFARTSKALSRLQEQMRQKLIEKTYFAWVEGALADDTGTLEHYLVHDEHKARIVKEDHPMAKLARLHYEVIDRQPKKSLVKIILETGRYHQIRIQISTIGCPVIGDAKYGRSSLPPQGIALHHGPLKFTHPVTKEPLQFEKIPHYFSL